MQLVSIFTSVLAFRFVFDLIFFESEFYPQFFDFIIHDFYSRFSLKYFTSQISNFINNTK